MEIEKWSDGTDMVCSECAEPIFKDQPRIATISHAPKKRKASHYVCQGGVVTVIGSPEPGVAEVTQYGSRRSPNHNVGLPFHELNWPTNR